MHAAHRAFVAWATLAVACSRPAEPITATPRTDAGPAPVVTGTLSAPRALGDAGAKLVGTWRRDVSEDIRSPAFRKMAEESGDPKKFERQYLEDAAGTRLVFSPDGTSSLLEPPQRVPRTGTWKASATGEGELAIVIDGREHVRCRVVDDDHIEIDEKPPQRWVRIGAAPDTAAPTPAAPTTVAGKVCEHGWALDRRDREAKGRPVDRPQRKLDACTERLEKLASHPAFGCATKCMLEATDLETFNRCPNGCGLPKN